MVDGIEHSMISISEDALHNWLCKRRNMFDSGNPLIIDLRLVRDVKLGK